MIQYQFDRHDEIYHLRHTFFSSRSGSKNHFVPRISWTEISVLGSNIKVAKVPKDSSHFDESVFVFYRHAEIYHLRQTLFFVRLEQCHRKHHHHHLHWDPCNCQPLISYTPEFGETRAWVDNMSHSRGTISHLPAISM